MTELLRLERRDLAALIAAQWHLLLAQWIVWRRPRGDLFSSAPPSQSGLEPTKDQATEALRLAVAVRRAAHHGIFRPACLVRSLALQRLLEHRDVRGSRVRVGVRVEQDRFEAHAWVQLGDLVLGDRAEHVRRFDGFSELQF